MTVPRKRGKVKKKPARKKQRKVSVDTNRKKKRKKRPASSKTKRRPKLRRIERQPDAKRSLAAKKGWETRRANAKAFAELQQQAAKSIEARLRFLDQPKVARQLQDDLIRTGLIRKGMVQSEETQILSRLAVAKQLGNFDEEAHALSIEFDWNIRDVYTLWFSP